MLRSHRTRFTAAAFATVAASVVGSGAADAAECRLEVIGQAYPHMLSCSVYSTGAGTCVRIGNTVYEVAVRCGTVAEVIVRAD